MLREFKHSGELLTQWHDITAKLYPDHTNLLDMIPEASKLSTSKLGFGSFTTTDTCSTAQKLWQFLNDDIQWIAKEERLTSDVIKNYKADCWQHLQNVWFGAVAAVLENELHDVLCDDDLPDIHQINLGIEDFSWKRNLATLPTMQRDVEKNSGNGKRVSYHFPLAQACGSTQQDFCLKGMPAVLMNLPCYL